MVFTREFSRQYQKLDHPVQERIQKAINRLKSEPRLGKPLTGLLSGRWSYRVGDYRILYKIYQDKFLVLCLTVGHRREIYK